MSKLSIINCPSPKQVESEHILEYQEDAQKYFDESILPLLKNAVYSPQRVNGSVRYAAYVEAALKAKGWRLRWDPYMAADVVEVKPKFQLEFPKWQLKVTRPRLFAVTVVYLAVYIRLMYLSDIHDPLTGVFGIIGWAALLTLGVYTVLKD